MLSVRNRGLIIFVLVGKFLSISKTSPSSGGFVCLISTTKRTLVEVVKTSNGALSSQPFWGVRDKSLATSNYMMLICKDHHRSLSQLCSRSLMKASISICWMVKRLQITQLSGETVLVPKHMHPFTPPFRTTALLPLRPLAF